VGAPVEFASATESDRWLRLLHDQLHHRWGADAAIIRHLLGVWLGEIARRARRVGAHAPPPGLLAAKRHIETHYLEPLTLERLARVARQSRQYFCERFRRSFGTTPINYAIRLRMEHAAELLSDAGLTITEVALASGFRDIYYFSRAFKRHAGLSPRGYRARRLAEAR
jgi:AraC-like DNA-binding protein